MAVEARKAAVRVGLIRLRDHCTFTWREPGGGEGRSVEVRATHCAECVAELEGLGYLLKPEDQGDR